MRSRYEGWPPEQVEEALAWLRATRDTVLDNAELREGDAVLDVGAGTGLLTFGALERVGEDGQVIALDVSADCLDELRRVAKENGVNGRLWYQLGDAAVLPVPDESVDAVLTRSVLIYVADKAGAAAEFFRVLRPGGRLSIFEPLNRHDRRLHEAVDLSPLGSLAERVRAEEEAWYARDDPMVDFDEHDLARAFADAGFVALRSELRPEDQELPVEQLLHAPGAPGRPSLLERWQEAFAPDEVEALVSFLRGLGGAVTLCWTQLFLAGKKPA